ncbi:DNA topology modulation protein FlaR [Parasulfitobacter algicola]|uniref:DNA topology modulation protein FlaR n=1 Tax=Parasulfitobacter algicola TaxID=2614809 RepID=A0ABX2J0S0_9RHOB|nr:DNA topology modulation protein FlaR [Sulfitobacter algicola]NSX56728.1 DNA topology modulation protein FlaR [Sulfitobacter algicola]
MKRVMIVGGPGSGKSTLARKLGDLTGLPVFHMDHIHWHADWVERDPAAKSAMTQDIHRRDKWIFEGGHSRTYAQRVQRADTFIWLDVPVALRLWRVFRRTIVHYGKSRPDLPDGCIERFDTSSLEFWSFILRTRHTARARLSAIYQDPPAHLKTYHLTSLRSVNRFLDDTKAQRR